MQICVPACTSGCKPVLLCIYIDENSVVSMWVEMASAGHSKLHTRVTHRSHLFVNQVGAMQIQPENHRNIVAEP